VKHFTQYIQTHLLRAAVLAAFCTVLLGGLLVSASLSGWPPQIFRFAVEPPEELPEGTDIAGWATIDRDSYVVGEPIRYRARILYRPDRVAPDLDQFVRSLSFLPVEKRESFENLDSVGGGINEYTLEYILQGVDVSPHTSYQLDPVVLFYKQTDSSVRELLSLRLPTPPVFFTEY
jgi:hypothetical protein